VAYRHHNDRHNDRQSNSTSNDAEHGFPRVAAGCLRAIPLMVADGNNGVATGRFNDGSGTAIRYDAVRRGSLPALKRAPGGGGSSGGPAKHCASAIHCRAGSPQTVSVVSATLRTWVTTWQKSSANPSTLLSAEGGFHSQTASDGVVRRT